MFRQNKQAESWEEIESAEWNNIIEKSWYIFFSVLQQSVEKWFPEYEKMVEEWDVLVDDNIEDEILDDEATDSEDTDAEDTDQENIEDENAGEGEIADEENNEGENNNEESDNEPVEPEATVDEVVFSDEEQNEIQEIVELLE